MRYITLISCWICYIPSYFLISNLGGARCLISGLYHFGYKAIFLPAGREQLALCVIYVRVWVRCLEDVIGSRVYDTV